MSELIDLDNLPIPKKPRKPRAKKVKVVEEVVEEVDIEELEYHKELLLQLSLNRPEILTKPVIVHDTSLIETMSLDEIKARINQANRMSAAQLDDSTTRNIISISNQAIGTLLGCAEELQTSTATDQLLQSSAKEYLSINVLDYIPTELKLMGIYSLHVSSAYVNARRNPTVATTPNLTEV